MAVTSATICRRIKSNGSVEYFEENEYGLMAVIPAYDLHRLPPDINICADVQGKYYVYYADRRDVWFNDQYYFKVMHASEVEAYHRLGKHPSFPVLHQESPTSDGKTLAIIERIHGESPTETYLSTSSLDSQYKFYSIIYQAIAAIDFAHSLGIELYDMNSGNVLINAAKGRIWFIDLDRTIRSHVVTDEYDLILAIGLIVISWKQTDLINFITERIFPDFNEEIDELFNPEEYPGLILEFLHRTSEQYPEGPMHIALELMITRLEFGLANRTDEVGRKKNFRGLV